MKFIHGTRNDFFKHSEGKKIICFGASKQFEEAMLELKKEKTILEQVTAVIDSDTKKVGMTVEAEGKSFSVSGIEFFEKNFIPNAVILITSRFYYDIVKQLEQVDGWEDTEIFAYACIVLDEESDAESKYNSRITDQAIILYEEYLDCCKLSAQEKQEKMEVMETYIKDKSHRILPSVVPLHSNICTLNCEQCCDLLPMVKKPFYLSPDEVLKSLELVLKGVDKCIRVDLTDGEAFLYKELDILLESLIQNEKVETVLVMTNATVIPDRKVLKLLSHPKCFVRISDYGLLKQMADMVVVLEREQIRFSVFTDMKWENFKCNDLKKRKEGREWLRYEFLRCGNKKCSKALIGNRLYGCMPAFRYADVEIFESPNDYVVLSEEDEPDTAWNKIEHICLVDFIDTCEYCNFANTAAPFCRAGQQPGIVQSEYTIVKRAEF